METITLFLGKKCNNDCEMCSVSGLEKLNHESDYSDIIEKIRENGDLTNRIEFTGGEPTEHKDIVKIIGEAGNSGYSEIGLSSNGRNFSNKNFTEKLISLGLNSARISLHGPEEIHNQITHTNSFQESISGINNLKQCGVTITIDSVIMKKNIDHLSEMHKYILDMGIDQIGVAGLLSPSKDNSDFNDMAVSYEKRKKFFYKNSKLLEMFYQVFTINFPRCLLPIRMPNNFVFLSPYEKQESWNFEGGGMVNAQYDDQNKKISLCEKCPFSNNCYGFFKQSLNLFGERGVEKMFEIDHFIEKTQTK